MEHTIVKTFYESHGSTEVQVTIALKDFFKTGEQQWSLTGSCKSYCNDGSYDEDSLIPEDIIYYFPELSIFKILNGRDSFGVPVLPIKKGLLLIEDGELDDLMEYYLLDNCEKSLFRGITTPEYLSYLIKKLGIDSRWRMYSEEGINQLENVSGANFPYYNLNNKSLRFDMSLEEYKKIDSIVEEAYPDTTAAETCIAKYKEKIAKELIQRQEENKDDDKFLWVARDEDGMICAFKKKPYKDTKRGMWREPMYGDIHLFSDMYPEVKWTDEEPQKLWLKW